MKVRINQLYYITHLNNVKSILEKGILSHNKVLEYNIQYIPVYDETIVSKRKDRKTPQGRSLWDYANLYFQPRNPMLYRVLLEKKPEEIIILAISLDVLKIQGVYVSTGNAASYLSEILPAEDWKKVVSKNILEKEYWSETDGSKREIMAEVLVPDKVPLEYIKSIYVYNDEIAKNLKEKIGNTINIIPEPNFFFENPLISQLTQNLGLYKGDMFFSRMHTLTISVNVVGVMGKGLASRAKYQFPDVYVLYQDLCRKKILQMGVPYLYKRESSLDFQLADEATSLKNLNNETWFLLFPTKRHWKENADYNSIEKGMEWLYLNYKKEGIKSLAIPALGCGLGNLKWEDVGPMLCRYLKNFDIPVQIYLPAEKKIDEKFITKEYLLKHYA